VIQLLKEVGVDSPAVASNSASSKPSEVAAPDADNLDLFNMPATFDHEGDETSWQQGLPPGEVGPELRELELSESDSDSSAASILGVCLDGFDGDTWMLDAEGAHNDIQVGEVAGVNDPGDIPWRTTAWSAGGVDVGSAKVAKGQGGQANVASDGLMTCRIAKKKRRSGSAKNSAGSVGGNDTKARQNRHLDAHSKP